MTGQLALLLVFLLQDRLFATLGTRTLGQPHTPPMGVIIQRFHQHALAMRRQRYLGLQACGGHSTTYARERPIHPDGLPTARLYARRCTMLCGAYPRVTISHSRPSRAPLAPSEESITGSFHDRLYAGGGEWMWEHVQLQGPLATIAQAFRQDTAVCAKDGSYNPSLSPRTSRAGRLIYCSHLHCTLVTGSFFEDHPLAAGSYRGELLGLVALHFFALDQSALFKAKWFKKRVSLGAKHADLLRALCSLHRQLGAVFIYSTSGQVQTLSPAVGGGSTQLPLR